MICRFFRAIFVAATFLGVGCSDTAGNLGQASSSAGAASIAERDAGSGASSNDAAVAADGNVAGSNSPDTGDAVIPEFDGALRLDVPVPESGRVYVRLVGPSVVTPNGDPMTADDWDLAFEGFDVYTNSGPSGAGQGAAFGPLDLASFSASAAPAVPFSSPDEAGGAFGDWYAYDGASHALYSRFHVYGVKRGEALWKVQILSYYSALDNAPVSALYQLRYAEIAPNIGETRALQIDGTAGGLAGPAAAPSGCVDLASGQVSLLAPAEARTSTSWDLCLRRDSISVNGEAGGPAAVGAVDLQADRTAGEALASVKQETADSTRALFDGVVAASFANAQFRGDHVVSAFESGGWLDRSVAPVAPTRAAWLVTDALGKAQFLVAFSAFRSPTASSPGTVVMHSKPVK